MKFLKLSYTNAARLMTCVVSLAPFSARSQDLSAIAQSDPGSGWTLLLEWTAEIGTPYEMRVAPDVLGPWSPLLEEPIVADSNEMSIEVDPTSDRRFFRVRVADDTPNPTSREFERIPSGTTLIGSPEDELGHTPEEAQFEATFTNDFFVQTTETTNEEFVNVIHWALGEGLIAFDTNEGQLANVEGRIEFLTKFSATSALSWDGAEVAIAPGAERLPAVNVTWYGAMAYCHCLSLREELISPIDFANWSMALDQPGYRLPTEAEWEHACRAGTTTAFHTGDAPESLEEAEWFAWNSDGRLHEGAQKAPNPWGLFDISGNAMEWVWDVYEDYPTESVTDPSGPDPETQVLRRLRRVVRGGNFFSSEGRLRVARRQGFRPDDGEEEISFRIARTAIAPANE